MGVDEGAEPPSDDLPAIGYEPKQGIPKNLVDKRKGLILTANL